MRLGVEYGSENAPVNEPSKHPGEGPYSEPLKPETIDIYKELLLGHRDEDVRQIVAQEIRRMESEFSLGTQGFEVHELPAKERDVNDQEIVTTEYYDEITRLIKDITGAKQVALFGQIIRVHKRDALGPHDFIPGKLQGPSPRPHTDASPTDPLGWITNASMAAFLPNGAEMIKQASRWQMLGIWRPIKTIQRDPLAFTDSRSVPASDYRDIEGPRYMLSLLKAGDESKHRWYYCSGMTRDEIVVIKHFDTRMDLPAYRCAHTSINIPGTEDFPGRESIEVRALVCY